MRKVTTTFNVYKFSELSDTCQERVINEEIQFLIETMQNEPTDPIWDDCIHQIERLQTPWFLGAVMWEKHKDFILELCNDGEYLINGESYYGSD